MHQNSLNYKIVRANKHISANILLRFSRLLEHEPPISAWGLYIHSFQPTVNNS